MIRLCRGVQRLCFAAALAVLLPVAACAQVTVDPTVTLVGSLFHYEYSVTNNASEDLAIVTLEGIIPGPAAIQNLTAPTGFLANFDSGLGLVDFLADSQDFLVGTTVSGFSFDSPFSPQSIPFSALGVQGTPFAGTTQGPAGSPVVPEPRNLFLLCALSVPGSLLLRRRARK